jgi:hypothetical protein
MRRLQQVRKVGQLYYTSIDPIRPSSIILGAYLRAQLDVATIASITSQQGPTLPTSVFPENSGGTRNYPRDQAIGRQAWEYLRVESRCGVTVDENVVEKAVEEILTYEVSDDALAGIAGINTSINRRMIASITAVIFV